MSGAESIFFAVSATSVAAALVVLFTRRARVACLAFAACLLSLALVEVLLMAPLAAAIQILVALGVLALTWTLADDVRRERWMPGWASKVVALGVVALLSFVFLGTWARQWMTAGSDLDKRPDFGTLAAASTDLATNSLVNLALVGALLLCVVVAIGVAADLVPARADQGRAGK